ncbi:hypothetical protein [Priestia abyssalis]|uniref:hypothetical protein n=1 Tax=Priestia abyssalis TaxID=1221450 RepID=UPI00099522AB|nr:hypothetical protein [Priestia abyssalis]
MDDSSKFREYIEHSNFTPKHIQMLITIKYKNEIVVGIDGPSGLDLWEQSYMALVESYLNQEKVNVMYGIEPIVMRIKSLDNHLFEFSITDEWKPIEVYAKAVLPKKEFFEAILDGAERFWNTLNNYKVFEKMDIKEKASIEYPVLMTEKVEKLREKIKILLN